jgi:hypothetical protein
MFKILFDAKTVLSRESAQRPQTPYLRGTIVEGSAGGQNFAGRRVVVWGDANPKIKEWQGQAGNFAAQLRDEIQVEGSTQKSLVLDALRIKGEVYTGAELEAMEQAVADAQAINLNTRGARAISRPAAPGTNPAPTAPTAPGLAAGLPQEAPAPAPAAPF